MYDISTNFFIRQDVKSQDSGLEETQKKLSLYHKMENEKRDIRPTKKKWQVNSVVKTSLSVRKVWGSIPGSVNSLPLRYSPPLRGCVAQALNRGDMLRHSLPRYTPRRNTTSIMKT